MYYCRITKCKSFSSGKSNPLLSRDEPAIEIWDTIVKLERLSLKIFPVTRMVYFSICLWILFNILRVVLMRIFTILQRISYFANTMEKYPLFFYNYY